MLSSNNRNKQILNNANKNKLITSLIQLPPPEIHSIGQQSSKRLYLHHYYNFVLLVSVQVTDSLQNTVTIRPGSRARCFSERGEGDVKTPV